MKKNIIKPRPKRLNKGQEALYRMFVLALEKEREITNRDIWKCYENNAESHTWIYGTRYDEDLKKWRTGYHEGSVEYRQTKCTQWFLRTLGTLIMKGYLTALPRIKLTELNTIQNQPFALD